MLRSKISILIIIIFFSIKTYSQYTLSGIVKDTANMPLNYATVILFNGDSLISGCITDYKGMFKLKNIDKGKYLFEINYTGYTSFNKKLDINKDIHFETIVLKEKSQIIDDINITGQKTQTKTEVDRLVYVVGSSDKKNAKDTYQVLTKIPELEVNTIDKSVSIIGSDNTLILINNVKRDNDFLQSINPKNVKKVEVISNPSAKYLSRDVTGVINIITKEKTTGYKGEISEMITPNLNTNGWTNYNFTYSKNKINFYAFGFLSFLNEKKINYNIINKIYIDEEEIKKETRSNYGSFCMPSSAITSGCEINFNEKNFMFIDARLEGYSAVTKSNYDGIYSVNNVFQHNFQIDKQNKSNQNSRKYSIYYQNKPGNKGKLFAIEGNYNIFVNNYTLLYKEESPVDLYENNMKSKSLKKSYDLQADYSQNFGDIKGEGGYRIYYQDVIQKLTTETKNDSLDKINYKELKNYLYLNFNGKILEKLSFQTGIGAEFTNTNINNNETDTVNNNYLKLLPVIGLQYKINKKHSLKFNYLSSLNRPSISSLNPAERYSDTLKVSSGNPYLEPYYSHRFNLKYTYSHNKLYLSPSITYTYIPDYIVKIGQTDNNSIYHLTYQNLAKYDYLKMSLYMKLKLLKEWNIKSNIFSRYSKFNDVSNEINTYLWSYGWYVATDIKYKNLSFYLSYYRKPEFLSGKKKGRSADDSWFSAYYEINDNWNVGFDIRYFLLWKENYTIDDQYYYESYEHWNNNRYFQFLIDITYSFETGKKIDKKRKKIHNTDSSEGLDL